MKTHDYIARIGYTGGTDRTVRTLRALQEAHLLTVPFENLDIHSGIAITLDLPRIYEKIVVAKRGGFCYELNGLFHWLLLELGFKTKLLMGRVYDRGQGTYGQEFDHALCLVEIEGQNWLADVGFGDFSMHPLALALNTPIADVNGTFLIEGDVEGYYRVSRFSHDENVFVPQYRFSLKERQLSDFAAMCVYHQTSRLSSFTRSKVCSIATSSGRITLTDNKLIVTEDGVRAETPINGAEEFKQALTRYFDIDWSGLPLENDR